MDNKFFKHYMIVMLLGTFCYPIFKFFVHFAYPNFEPIYFRMPTLVFGLSFFILAYFKESIRKRIDLAFLIVSFITNTDYLFLLLKSYQTPAENYYFLGSFIVTVCSLISFKNKKHFNVFLGYILLVYTIFFTNGYLLNNHSFVKNDINNMIFIGLIILVAYLQTRVNIETDRELIETQRDLSQKSALLIEKSKMASLGEMAGGIAHEINNPLQIISSSAELLEMKNGESKETLLIKNTVSRIEQIVENLKIFSGESALSQNQIFEVNDSIKESVSLCVQKFKNHGIAIVFNENESFKVFGVKSEMKRVIINLLSNSFDSIISSNPTDKRIIIDLIDHENEVEIKIHDTGSLITQEISEKIFQPFFTTKKVGSGTGLGLSVSQGLIKKMGGEIGFVIDPKIFYVKIPKISNP